MTPPPLHVIVDNQDYWTAWGTAFLAGFFGILGAIATLVFQKWTRRTGKISIVVEEWKAQYTMAGAVSAGGPVGPHNATHATFNFQFDVVCKREDPLALRDVRCELRLGEQKWILLFWDIHGYMANMAGKQNAAPVIRTINVDGNRIAHFPVLGFIPKEAMAASGTGDLYLVAIDLDGNEYDVFIPRLRK